MKQGLIIGAAIILLLAAGVGVYFLLPSGPNQPKAVGTQNASYFSESAKVMYFYSDSCSWCIKQKAILEEIAKEGYRVKPMDVGTNQEYWKTYEISGTPTFIAPDGEKKVGYQGDAAALKTWLDKYK